MSPCPQMLGSLQEESESGIRKKIPKDHLSLSRDQSKGLKRKLPQTGRPSKKAMKPSTSSHQQVTFDCPDQCFSIRQ